MQQCWLLPINQVINNIAWKRDNLAPNQLVFNSFRTQVNSFSFWSIRTRGFGKFVLNWSIRTHCMVNSYSFCSTRSEQFFLVFVILTFISNCKNSEGPNTLNFYGFPRFLQPRIYTNFKNFIKFCSFSVMKMGIWLWTKPAKQVH